MNQKPPALSISIYRYNPDTLKPPRYDTFTLTNLGKDEQLLDVFERIKQTMDSTLSYRKSCRHGICGSCAVKVEGVPVLACKTNVSELLSTYGNGFTVDPLNKEKIIRDLVINMDTFWKKYQAVRPFLEGLHSPGLSSEKPRYERRISPVKMNAVNDAEYCIQCGSCYYVCPVVRWNNSFLGPAALTKAYRFACDVRDFSDKRLELVHAEYSGVWDCAKCLLCVDACPKNINPFAKITFLHVMGTKRGINTKTKHFRHTTVFSRQVRRTGYINEFFLALGTLRLAMVKLLLRGFFLVIKGKMHFNFLFPRSIKRYELRAILRRTAKEDGRAKQKETTDE